MVEPWFVPRKPPAISDVATRYLTTTVFTEPSRCTAWVFLHQIVQRDNYWALTCRTVFSSSRTSCTYKYRHNPGTPGNHSLCQLPFGVKRRNGRFWSSSEYVDRPCRCSLRRIKGGSMQVLRTTVLALYKITEAIVMLSGLGSSQMSTTLLHPTALYLIISLLSENVGICNDEHKFTSSR